MYDTSIDVCTLQVLEEEIDYVNLGLSALESYSQQLIKLKSPTLSESEYLMALVGIENVLGGKLSDELMPAQSRSVSTLLALEGILNGAKNLFAKAVEHIKTWIRTLMRFLNKHLSFIGRLNKKYKALSSQLKNTEEVKVKQVTLPANVYESLTIGGKFCTDISKEMDNITELSKKALSSEASVVYIKELATTLSGVNIKVEDKKLVVTDTINDLNTASVKVYKMFVSDVGLEEFDNQTDDRFKDKNGEKKATFKSKKEFLGSKSFFLDAGNINKVFDEEKMGFIRLKVSLLDTVYKAPRTKSEKVVSALNLDKLKLISASGESLTEALLTAKADVGKREDIFNKLLDVSSKLYEEAVELIKKHGEKGDTTKHLQVYTADANLIILRTTLNEIKELYNIVAQPQKGLKEVGYSAAKAAYLMCVRTIHLGKNTDLSDDSI